jgi:hypothetical protein
MAAAFGALLASSIPVAPEITSRVHFATSALLGLVVILTAHGPGGVGVDAGAGAGAGVSEISE